MATFAKQLLIRFRHTDTAGIVFYPRYVEMINDLVEDFFADVVGFSFRQMHLNNTIGVPTVNLNIDFLSSAHLGDEITLSLRVLKVGNTSFKLRVTGEGADNTTIFGADVTLVYVDFAGDKTTPLPLTAEMRKALKTYSE